jgi:hypothetical protein
MSPTKYVVGAVIGIPMVIMAWYILGFPWALVPIALLLYESWTLVNKYPNDTISEIIWQFAKRPMVPFLFGCAFGWALTTELLGNAWLIAAVAFLMGHFFFQRHEDGNNVG